MSIKGPGERPFTPPISPKDIKTQKAPEEKLVQQPAVKAPAQPGIGRGPELDSHALATRIAILATEAKEKELKFEDIIDRVIQETGLTNAQGALEEGNRKLQKAIEDEIVKIKENKELMEEAESWQEFAEVLSRMNEEQVEGFLGLLKETIRVGL
jgi:DNA repair exonuclease SbcCD nuclease subunit